MESRLQTEDRLTEEKFILQGLACSNCAARIEDKASELPYVEQASLNLATSKITVKGKQEHLEGLEQELQEISDQIEPGLKVYREGQETRGAGEYEQEEVGDDNPGNNRETGENKIVEFLRVILDYKVRFTLGSLLAVIAFVIYYFTGYGTGLPFWLEPFIFAVSYLLVGWPVLESAFKNISHGEVFDENFLMMVATLGAFGIGEYPEGVAVMLFYMVGEMVQNRAVDSSRRSIRQLMDIQPERAHLKTGGETREVPPEEITPGDIILVQPGEKVPLDGQIMLGSSTVDTSALTGESAPREVKEGDEVLSGMINQEGLLTVRVIREYSQSTVSRILEMVEEASSRKAPTEKFITRFARYYTPIVVYTALAITVIPPLVMGGGFVDWFYRALIFLVVSCPCALVISIPLGFFGGIGRASKQGILVKGGNYLEALNQVKGVVFDKTGTLTRGEFSVTGVNPAPDVDYSKEELLGLAALVESSSSHPIARSIVRAADKGMNPELVESSQEISGKGIEAVIDGRTVLVGNTGLLESQGIDYPGFQSRGTALLLAVDREYVGYIEVDDQLKPNAETAVQELDQLGVSRRVMLTGDREAVAVRIADKLGLDDYYSELLPDQKVARVEAMLEGLSGSDKLAFVGDGINDAPVLARADIGVAMGGLGSDAAIEAADVVLMNDDPYKLVTAIETARITRKIVWQNIALALGVKGIVMVLGVLGMATMWEAVFADVGVALLAVLNSMRIIKGGANDA
ncbi:MAG: heavy metal translocating P-type ATPase [Bacillota bacterium]